MAALPTSRTAHQRGELPLLKPNRKLSDGDKAIFRRAAQLNDPSIITNFYLRNEDSGTWWRPVPDEKIAKLEMPKSIEAAQRWQKGFNDLREVWMHIGKPEYFTAQGEPLTREKFKEAAAALENVYRVSYDVTTNAVSAFHHPHGVLFLPWQRNMYRSNHSLQVVAGGFGSAKTFGKLLTMLVRAVTLPGYRALALAPYSFQALEVYKQALLAIRGSAFERFLVSQPMRPVPSLIFENDLVGQTVIECLPVLEGAEKLLTVTADEALVDQAEQISDLNTLIREVSSRFRGQVRGRPRIGQITLVANSADNPQLWDLFDEGADENNSVWSYSPATFENAYLTVDDLIRYESRVAKDEESRRMYILGERPIGTGEHFTAANMERCRDKSLDERMTQALNDQIPGWVRKSAPRCNVHQWEMPPEQGHSYIVAADAGWDNPPERNAACIGVWDITEFPKAPAVLVAFSWVFGNNSPNPWITKYMEYVLNYRAIGMNGFDATGSGSGYERMEVFQAVAPMPVIMGGQRKFTYLNLTKKLVADAMLRFPTIPHLFSQCAKYRIPDENLRQDIVMMLLVTSALLEAPYYASKQYGMDDELSYDGNDRYWRPESDRDSEYAFYDTEER